MTAGPAKNKPPSLTPCWEDAGVGVDPRQQRATPNSKAGETVRVEWAPPGRKTRGWASSPRGGRADRLWPFWSTECAEPKSPGCPPGVGGARASEGPGPGPGHGQGGPEETWWEALVLRERQTLWRQKGPRPFFPKAAKRSRAPSSAAIYSEAKVFNILSFRDSPWAGWGGGRLYNSCALV